MLNVLELEPGDKVCLQDGAIAGSVRCMKREH